MGEAAVKASISVVLPTYRRIDLLGRCLAALARQDLGRPFEVIVVHDGPNERARAVAAVWEERLRESGLAALRYSELAGHCGPAAVRNVGWRLATADLIAFTDDDTVPAPTWLRHALDGLPADADAGWGRLEWPLGPQPTDYELDAAGLARSEFVTANCFCRKRTLEQLGGFDERFSLAWREDSDLFFRLIDAGAHIARLDDAVVVHPVRPAGWGTSMRQQKKVLFDALLFKKHPTLYRQRIRRRARWDYYAIVAALLAAVGGAAAGAWAIAVAAAAVWALLTARLCGERLRRATKRWPDIVEMLVTSAAIPPIAVFWRMVGVLRFRVVFV